MGEFLTTGDPRVEHVRHLKAVRERDRLRQKQNWDRLRTLGMGVAPDVIGRRLPTAYDPGMNALSDGAWKGRRVFIVGGGPSLRDFDFSRLQGELVIGINRAYERINCTVLYSMDERFFGWAAAGTFGSEALARYREFKGVKLAGLFAAEIPAGCQAVMLSSTEALPTSLGAGLFHGNNSGYSALLLAYLLGANPIYLLGYDCKYEDGRSHWHGGYPAATTESTVGSFIPYFERLAPELSKKGVTVVNLNPDSALRCFPFREFDSIRDLGRAESPDSGFMVISYYTKGTGYEQEVERLETSLRLHQLPHRIYPYAPAGSWRANLNFKSEVILAAFDRFPGKDIVFLDSDAIVRRYPVLFDSLSRSHKFDISAHFFNYRPESGDADELLSGTLWIQNNDVGRRLVAKWHEIGLANPGVRHQMCLKHAVAELKKEGVPVRVNRHPFAYTCIFDYAGAYSTEPVIEHFQASRRLRREVGYGSDLLHRVPGAA